MIKINLDKAKEVVSHPKRREKRSEEFKKVDGDNIYSVLSDSGEAKRKDIKANDDLLQAEIDNASSIEELTIVMKEAKIL